MIDDELGGRGANKGEATVVTRQLSMSCIHDALVAHEQGALVVRDLRKT